ncbi:MAG: DUF2079 domain-containing protein [Candidatus Dormiibacterota bacterium]
MLAWSTLLWHRFAQTRDYSAYYQAWWLIAHGHFDPFSTILGVPFWQNNFELFMWPLALIGVVLSHGPALLTHGPTLLWLQDACLVGAEVVAWRWMREETAKLAGLPGRLLAGIGLVLLVANPWAWWSISFDFHMELVAVPFALLAAYDLAHERRRMWLWAVITLLCGDAETTWVVGLGLGALLAGRRWRAKGVVLIVLGIAWLLLSTSLHGDRGGSLIGAYGYLVGPVVSSAPSLSTLVLHIVTHPGEVLTELWRHRVDTLANLAPGGLVGIANPWILGLALPVVLATDLFQGNRFSQPLFQNILLYVVVPLGTVLVLTYLYRRWRGVALGLGALAVANALVWSAIWGPQIPATWLLVPGPSAAVLARADALIPPSAEVVVSQGVSGRFGDRSLLYLVFAASQRIPLRSRDTWWIVAPSVGIETESTIAGAALVAELAGTLHAHLVLHGAGVWIFHWVAPAGRHSIAVAKTPTVVKAWLFAGTAGTPLVNGPASSWRAASTGHAGYVVSGDYWRESPGDYEATVTLAASGRVKMEVLNATGNVVLAHRSLASTDGLETISMPVPATRAYPQHPFQGLGPFHVEFIPQPPGDLLVVQVWSSGRGRVDVQQVGIHRVG